MQIHADPDQIIIGHVTVIFKIINQAKQKYLNNRSITPYLFRLPEEPLGVGDVDLLAILPVQPVRVMSRRGITCKYKLSCNQDW